MRGENLNKWQVLIIIFVVLTVIVGIVIGGYYIISQEGTQQGSLVADLEINPSVVNVDGKYQVRSTLYHTVSIIQVEEVTLKLYKEEELYHAESKDPINWGYNT
ncbi:hypothetical protein AKJ41_01690 [candidate division MSBL1 archaeon SCGC-AAA259O05]|uniref:Uncharacterized protein n=1 Tax=candidate division MSBL1 archaeon SCGC-AAA259O05 TaxID=1698271 RepID=A0A133V4Q9_9EURY|nr:hypothetical protein AKJ41_01690 [candidate division MSBL1 archaeon SCGC-AAA259O05]